MNYIELFWNYFENTKKKFNFSILRTVTLMLKFDEKVLLIIKVQLIFVHFFFNEISLSNQLFLVNSI